MSSPKNILIVRTDRIGDVVLTLPMVHAVKKVYPDANIYLMLRNYTAPLADNNPDISGIIIPEENEGKFLIKENVDKIKEKLIDTCFVVHPRFRLALILLLAGVKNRVGTGYRIYSFLFNKRIFQHRKNGEKHELEHNTDMLKEIGIIVNPTPENVEFNIHPDGKSVQFVRNKLTDLGLDFKLPIVIIHPGSGGSAVDLPISRFLELTSKLAQELNINLVITGSSSEKDLCSKFVLNNNVINAAELFNLKELTALISLSKLLIANSTGPIHIAAALGKYTIGFYPKIKACSKERWGPYSSKSIVFEPELNCTSCNTKQCAERNCMSEIDINKVFSSVQNIVEL